MFVVPYHQRDGYGRSQMRKARDKMRDDTEAAWRACSKAGFPQFGKDLAAKGCPVIYFYNPGANLANDTLMSFNDETVAILVRSHGYNPLGLGETVPDVHPNYIPLIPRKVSHATQTRTEDRGAGG